MPTPTSTGPTSADLHRSAARDMLLGTIMLWLAAAILFVGSALLALDGMNAFLVILTDGVAIGCATIGALLFVGMREEYANVRLMHTGEPIRDYRKMWLDQCECAACQRAARSAGVAS